MSCRASRPPDRGRRPCWCWPTARCSRARRSGPCRPAGWPPASWCSTPCCRGYQEVITDPSYAGQVIAFTYPHIGNYGINAADDEAGRPFCRGVVVRDLTDRPSNWRSTEGLERLPGPPRRPGDHRHRHPPAHPPPARRRAPCPAPSARPAGGRCWRPPRAAEPGTDGRDLVAEVTTAAALHAGRRARCRVVAYDFGMKRDHPAPPGRAGHGRGGAGLDPGRRGAGRSSPTACSSPTARATRPPSAAPDGHRRRPARPGAGLRHLPRPPAAGHRPRRPRPTSCPSATTAATTRCGGWRPARSRSPARTTTTPSTPASLPGAEVTHVNLNDGVVEGIRPAVGAGLRRAVPPRGRARPARRPLPVRRVPGPDGDGVGR